MIIFAEILSPAFKVFLLFLINCLSNEMMFRNKN